MIVRGMGDTMCTPTNCAGIYPAAMSNYNAMLYRASQAGVITEQPGSQTEAIDVQQVQAAEANLGGAANYAGYYQMEQAFGIENCGAIQDVGSQYSCSQRNTAKQNVIGNLQSQYHDLVPWDVISSMAAALNVPGALNVTNTVASAPAVTQTVIPQVATVLPNTYASVSATVVPGTIQKSGAAAADTTNTTNTQADGTTGVVNAIDPGSSISDWLSQTLISGFPNWGLVAAGVGAVALVMMSQRR